MVSVIIKSCSPGAQPHTPNHSPNMAEDIPLWKNWHVWLEREPFEDVYYRLLHKFVFFFGQRFNVYWKKSYIRFWCQKKQHNLHLVNPITDPGLHLWHDGIGEGVLLVILMANDPWTAPALKSNISPENRWLEDVYIPCWNSPFLGDMLIFEESLLGI